MAIDYVLKQKQVLEEIQRTKEKQKDLADGSLAQIKLLTNNVRTRIKVLSNKVKVQTLEIASQILENPDSVPPELYAETYLSILRNAVPKAQEITGEDGEPIAFQIVKYLDDDDENIKKTAITLPIYTEELPAPDTKSI